MRQADHIDALTARAEGNIARAIAILRGGAEGEPTGASTPPTYIPTHELLGDLLLQNNQPGDADVAYQAAGVVRPNRSRALLGLARSLSAGRRHCKGFRNHSHSGLRGAHDALQAWCKSTHQALAGPSWEVYGHWSKDPALLRTDTYYLLNDV